MADREGVGATVVPAEWEPRGQGRRWGRTIGVEGVGFDVGEVVSASSESDSTAGEEDSVGGEKESTTGEVDSTTALSPWSVAHCCAHSCRSRSCSSVASRTQHTMWGLILSRVFYYFWWVLLGRT